MKKSIPSVTVDNFVEESPKDFVPARFDADGVQVSSSIGSDGLEYPDPIPMSPHVPASLQIKDEGMRDVIKRIAQEEAIAVWLRDQGIETEEEANDFDVDEDPLDPLTAYEKVFEPPPVKEAAQKDAVTTSAQTVPVSGAVHDGKGDSAQSTSSPPGVQDK